MADSVDELKAELLQVRDELVHLEVEAGRLRGENTVIKARLAAGSDEVANRLHKMESSLWWRFRMVFVGPFYKLLEFMRSKLRRNIPTDRYGRPTE